MHYKSIILFTLQMLLFSMIFADEIDNNIISAPMFDDRITGRYITLKSGSVLYNDMELKSQKLNINEELRGEIIGRKLFPIRNFNNYDVEWIYYIKIIKNNENIFGCVSDKDFQFINNDLEEGIYSFSFIPENDYYPILCNPNIRLYIKKESDAYKVFIGYIHAEKFISLAESAVVVNENEMYYTFILKNIYLVIPKISDDMVTFMHVKNQYASDANAPMILLDSSRILPIEPGQLFGLAKCNNNSVRIRENPCLNGKIMAQRLNKDYLVEVLQRSDDKEKVYNDYYYWYKIKTFNNIIGWVYGEFLDLQDIEWD